MTEQRIGLSLSFCIGDVIAGKVPEDEIHGIVAGTAAQGPEEIDQLIATYREIYWKDDPDRGEALARKLFAEGRVYQPRIEGEPAPTPVPLHWLNNVPEWQKFFPTDTYLK
jgi:hypothetical protein